MSERTITSHLGIFSRISRVLGEWRKPTPEEQAVKIIKLLNKKYDSRQREYARKIQIAQSRNEQFFLISELKNSFISDLDLQLATSSRKIKEVLKAAFELQADLDNQVYKKTHQNRYRENALLNSRAAGAVQMSLETRLNITR